MTITSPQYIVDLDGSTNISIKATVDSVALMIPLDPDNIHYAEILRQVEAGNLYVQSAITELALVAEL